MNNDFHKTHDIFDLFKDLAVKDMDNGNPMNGGDEVVGIFNDLKVDGTI